MVLLASMQMIKGECVVQLLERLRTRNCSAKAWVILVECISGMLSVMEAISFGVVLGAHLELDSMESYSSLESGRWTPIKTLPKSEPAMNLISLVQERLG